MSRLPHVHRPRRLPRALVGGLASATALALVAAAVASTPSGAGDAPRVELHAALPSLLPTLACPAGDAALAIRTPDGGGSGRACATAAVTLRCATASRAYRCRRLTLTTSLRLPGGTIEASATVVERWTCREAACLTATVEQRWHGHVTRTTGRLGALAGERLTGGGTIVIDGAGRVVSSDLTLAVAGAHAHAGGAR